MSSTVRVNLLPPEIAQRTRQRRLLGVVGGLLVLYVVLLAALYVVKLDRVNRARDARDTAQAELQTLQTRLVALSPFRVLEQELEQRNAVLAQAMVREVSTARLLNELALVFPASSSLRTLTLSLQPDPAVAAVAAPPPPADATGAAPPTPAPTPIPTPAPAPPDLTEPIIGAVTFDGYSVDEYAPGVRSVVVDLRGVPGFVEPKVVTAQIEDLEGAEVTGYVGDADIDASAYTRRYADGLPVQGLR